MGHMRMIKSLWFSVRSLVFRAKADADIDEELSYHIDREAAMYERDGMSRDEARREAVRQFGGIARYRDECRDVRRTSLLDDLASDVRFALRLVRLHPGFSANVILVAALGIAVCASAFSVVSGILLTPLPFANASHVASVQLEAADGSSSAAFPASEFARIARDTTLVAAVAAFEPGGATVEWQGEPERVRLELVTPSFFRVFEITPVAGRVFTNDEGAERSPVALLGYDFWRARFNGDPSVVGKTVKLDSTLYTIVGVTPRYFRAQLTSEPHLWLPKPTASIANPSATVNAALRTRDGVSLTTAAAWMATTVHTKMRSGVVADSVVATGTLIPISELISGYIARPLYVFLGAVLLVLALVAANVTTMLLARSTSRDTELTVRRALGASGGREIRQLVTESVVLTGIGGVLGVIASVWMVATIRGLGVRVLPRIDVVRVDWRVLVFAVCATMLTGVIGGLAPAIVARRTDRMRRLAGSTARVTKRRTSTVLVVAQVALSVVLLVGAGLLMKSFLRVLPSDPGFAIENRATLSVTLRNQSAFPDSDKAAAQRFVREVDGRLRAVRGVRDVAAMTFLPLTGTAWVSPVELPGMPAPAKPFTAFQNYVTPNFFDLMRIPIARGRAFRVGDDGASERVAIVNATAAARWWPNENPIGRQVVLKGRDRFAVTIVGVARDIRLNGTDTRIRPQIYYPMAQGDSRNLSFIVHTTSDSRGLSRELQRAIWSVAPHLAIATTTDLATIAVESVGTMKFFSWAMSTFAIAAVTLSALAVYALLAFAVTQRRREIGIRLALGATPMEVAAMVVRTAVALGGTGVVIGVVSARGLSRFLASILLEVSATDAGVYIAMGAAALVVATAAAAIPAYHAVRIDPVKSLRE